MPSLIICRTSRKRLAPTARRIANSFRRLAPRAISMFARFMHASVMIRPISATKNPINAGFNFRGIGTLVPAGSKRDASAFVGAHWQRRILLVETARDRVETGFRGFNRDARRQTHHRQELFGIALMQHIVGELRSERGRCRDRNEQLRGVDGKRAVEILRRDSDDRRDLPIQAKRFAPARWERS